MNAVLRCLVFMVAVLPMNISFGNIRISFRFGDHFYRVDVADEELERLPNWPVEKPEPPVSIGSARRIASEWLKTALENRELSSFIEPSKGCGYRLTEIKLRSLYDDHWYYLVSFEEVPNPGLVWSGAPRRVVEVVIDMSGKVRMPSDLSISRIEEKQE